MKKDKYEEPTADTVFNAICALDNEFERKFKNPKTKSSYFGTEIIEKCSVLDWEMVKLSIDEKMELAKKIEEVVPNLEGQYMTTVMGSFYEGIHQLISSYQRHQRLVEEPFEYKGNSLCKVMKPLG